MSTPSQPVPAGASPYTFRTTVAATDPYEVRRIVTATEMFSPAEVALAKELVFEYLAKSAESGYAFIFAEREGTVRGYACYGPIPATEASFDLYWIAVHPTEQRQGLGRALLAETERRIVMAGGRRIYVDTSSRAQYAPTRAFYEAAGYAQAVLLPDFYAPGDGKIIFWKSVSPGSG